MDELERLLAERYGLRPLDGRSVRRAVSEQLGDAPENGGLATMGRIDGHSGLLRRLAAARTVGETYFFRHAEHADALLACVVRQLAVKPEAHVWSAGCATGEEPYSLAIVLRERLGEERANRVRIDATDLNERAVVAAKAGRYGEWSLRATSPGRRARWFVKEGQTYALGTTICACVRYFPLSIQEHLALMAPNSLDLVLFRNVGVYLTADALEALFRGFARVLVSGGMLSQAATDPAPPSGLFVRTNHESTSLFVAVGEGPAGQRKAPVER